MSNVHRRSALAAPGAEELEGDGEIAEVAPEEHAAAPAEGKAEEPMTEEAVTAYFAKGSTTVYTSMDVSCYSASANLNTCLNKGDKVFLFNSMMLPASSIEDSDAATISESTGNMYEVEGHRGGGVTEGEAALGDSDVALDEGRVQRDGGARVLQGLLVLREHHVARGAVPVVRRTFRVQA